MSEKIVIAGGAEVDRRLAVENMEMYVKEGDTLVLSVTEDDDEDVPAVLAYALRFALDNNVPYELVASPAALIFAEAYQKSFIGRLRSGATTVYEAKSPTAVSVRALKGTKVLLAWHPDNEHSVRALNTAERLNIPVVDLVTGMVYTGADEAVEAPQETLPAPTEKSPPWDDEGKKTDAGPQSPSVDDELTDFVRHMIDAASEWLHAKGKF